MDTIEKIVKVFASSREMAGYATFSANNLDSLRKLLGEFKEEIKTELKEELKK